MRQATKHSFLEIRLDKSHLSTSMGCYILISSGTDILHIIEFNVFTLSKDRLSDKSYLMQGSYPLKCLKISKKYAFHEAMCRAYFASNIKNQHKKTSKNVKSKEELARELNEIKMRIGKIESVKEVNPELKKAEKEHNRRYMNRFWLKMSIIVIFNMF